MASAAGPTPKNKLNGIAPSGVFWPTLSSAFAQVGEGGGELGQGPGGVEAAGVGEDPDRGGAQGFWLGADGGAGAGEGGAVGGDAGHGQDAGTRAAAVERGDQGAEALAAG